MRPIICVGYFATGSSAVDDYLREFNNIAQAREGVECTFLQSPDGISDMEFNLIENPHRHNSGFALKRYLHYVKTYAHTYHLLFGKEWERLSEKYIDDLTEFEFQGYWSGDKLYQTKLETLYYYFCRFINKLLPKRFQVPNTYNYFPKRRIRFCNVSEEEFIDKTYSYLQSLLNILNPENREYVVLDQAISAMNINRYLRYFKNEAKVIVVDRDPRDVYIQEIILKGKVLPKDVYQFAAVYRHDRHSIDEFINPEEVLFVKFEDLIYNYTETTGEINNFLGLKEENHLYCRKFFNPDISKNNTNLWKKYPNFNTEVMILEDLLPEFLYNSWE